MNLKLFRKYLFSTDDIVHYMAWRVETLLQAGSIDFCSIVRNNTRLEFLIGETI